MSLAQPKFIVEAFGGKKGTGKDWHSSQSYTSDPTGTVIFAFADWIKTHCYALGREEVFDAHKTATTRKFLIDTGTANRKEYGQAYYAVQMLGFIRLLKSRGFKRLIISDLRFKVEYFALCEAADLGEFDLRLFYIHAPKRNQLRIERESAGDKEIAKLLAEDPSEVEMDAIVLESNHFTIINNDPAPSVEVKVE